MRLGKIVLLTVLCLLIVGCSKLALSDPAHESPEKAIESNFPLGTDEERTYAFRTAPGGSLVVFRSVLPHAKPKESSFLEFSAVTWDLDGWRNINLHNGRNPYNISGRGIVFSYFDYPVGSRSIVGYTDKRFITRAHVVFSDGTAMDDEIKDGLFAFTFSQDKIACNLNLVDGSGQTLKMFSIKNPNVPENMGWSDTMKALAEMECP